MLRQILISCSIPAILAAVSACSGDDKIDFNRQVRAILSDNCYQCHGPDDAAREAGLRLDTFDGATESAIVPGEPESSEMIQRLVSDDPDSIMPPPDSQRKLTAAQIELLRRWVRQGANYQGHWAFETPVRPKVPKNTGNPVDAFVERKLEQEGLYPNPAADKSTLIRRVTLDLTGLPPTASEVDAFLADHTPQAYERVVDRLLSSPHYGERMAIPWLDFARYADSNGFQSDGSRTLWAWRDWLIRALNENKPFDQFTIEQLAGDMLPNATQDQIIATGFNRNHRLNGEGGRIVDEWFVETVIDRVETTGLTWLGLTFNCCRCHDHKYDPISQREFYQLFAFFNSVEESGVLAPNGKNGDNTPPVLTLMTPAHERELERLKMAETTAKQVVATLRKSSQQRREKWESEFRKTDESEPTWNLASDIKITSSGGATIEALEDGSYLATGTNPGFDNYIVDLALGGQSVSGLQLEVLPHQSLAQGGFGRSSNGNIVLSQVNAFLVQDKKRTPIRFSTAQADYSQPGWDAANLLNSQHKKLNGKLKTKGWALSGNEADKRVPRRLLLVTEHPVDVPPDSRLQIELNHASPYTGHNIGCFRLSWTSTPAEELTITPASLPANVLAVLAKQPSERSQSEQKSWSDYFSANKDSKLIAAIKQQNAASKSIADYRNKIPTTMVMKESKPREAFILERGEYDKPKDKVERGLPAVLPPMPEGQPMDRLGLANWIVNPANPLTARVWVNRAWEQLFGTGIVKTTENFGSQAEFPSHPELLDFLATEFVSPTALPDVNGQPAHHWDMKAILKLLVMSDAYKRSSKHEPKSSAVDPENRLLARGPRFRLSGELIRDSALAVSGLLVDRIGGPSVRPYMPEKVWDETSVYGNLRNYKHDRGEGLYRKTMYTIWKRTAAPPTMLLFDAPNREVCTIKRSKTNTPLQALSLLNEVTFVEAARALAVRMIRDGGDDAESRIRFAYKCMFSREPSPDEILILTSGLQRDQDYFESNPDAAKQLTTVGDWQPETAPDPVEWATYTTTANVLLNLDEFVTR